MSKGSRRLRLTHGQERPKPVETNQRIHMWYTNAKHYYPASMVQLRQHNTNTNFRKSSCKLLFRTRLAQTNGQAVSPCGPSPMVIKTDCQVTRWRSLRSESCYIGTSTLNWTECKRCNYSCVDAWLELRTPTKPCEMGRDVFADFVTTP